MENNDNTKLAQSASALGAGILGFGLGAKWGFPVSKYAILIIITGGFLHIYGMYIVQLKSTDKKKDGIAKILWISAWICLIVLVAIVIYFFIQ
jgi:hypothetical protein